MDLATPVGTGETLARLLSRHRRANCLTQEELAEAAGLSVRAVRNLELGRVGAPRWDSVRRLAQALHLSADDDRNLRDAARGRPPRPPRLRAVDAPAPVDERQARVVVRIGSGSALVEIRTGSGPAEGAEIVVSVTVVPGPRGLHLIDPPAHEPFADPIADPIADPVAEVSADGSAGQRVA